MRQHQADPACPVRRLHLSWRWDLAHYFIEVIAEKEVSMCRSIKTLRNAEIPATQEEIRAAALQYVRKVSGYRKPSKANTEAFEQAVEEVAEATRILLAKVTIRGKTPTL